MPGGGDCGLAAPPSLAFVSGVQVDRFQEALNGMITEAQGKRIGAALAPIMA